MEIESHARETENQDVEFTLVRSVIVESFVRKTRDHSTSSEGAKRTFVCFPFRENYHRNLNNVVPCLSAHFLDEQKWHTFATEYLSVRPIMEGATPYAPHCMRRYRYCELDGMPHGAGDLPFSLTDSVTVERILFEDKQKVSKIFAVSVRPPGSNMRYECVAKVVDIRASSPSWKWHHSRENIGTSKKPRRLRCCPAWSEPIALSKIYPSKFLGNATFFDREGGTWYSVIFMPHYRGTFYNLVSKVLPLFGPDGLPKVGGGESDNEQVRLWPAVLLASLMQIILYTIPKAKKSHLVAHNDLKLDNVAYRRTSRKYVYVKVVSAKRSVILAIPTYGRMFTLIDFGWASISCSRERIQVTSTCPKYNLQSAMRVWNYCTDFAQVAYALWRELREGFARDVDRLYELHQSWWDLLDALSLLASTDQDKAVFRVTEQNWNAAFYSESSMRCHFKCADSFVDMAKGMYEHRSGSVPKGRLMLEYDISLLSSQTEA
jgi:hypothetical protein